jgi:8-hydroxy-5-deazaflavin:NADPH oxidoreductase
MKLAFVGGTGPEGLGLAIRFAAAGHAIQIGSRLRERGEEGAATVRAAVPGATAGGGSNEAAVVNAEIVFLTFPYTGQRQTLEALAPLLAGKIVCCVVAPLEFIKGIGAVAVAVKGNSAAEECAAQLTDSRVVSAFQNMSAARLRDLNEPVPADVLVCGADADAKQLIISLAGQISGARGIDGGHISNSRYVEMLTSLLVNLNRKHKTESSVRFVGIGD